MFQRATSESYLLLVCSAAYLLYRTEIAAVFWASRRLDVGKGVNKFTVVLLKSNGDRCSIFVT